MRRVAIKNVTIINTVSLSFKLFNEALGTPLKNIKTVAPIYRL